jgi:hypothetical protein
MTDWCLYQQCTVTDHRVPDDGDSEILDCLLNTDKLIILEDFTIFIHCETSDFKY